MMTPEATQFFEAYSIADGACVWEAVLMRVRAADAGRHKRQKLAPAHGRIAADAI
jgi:hypothetical protein